MFNFVDVPDLNYDEPSVHTEDGTRIYRFPHIKNDFYSVTTVTSHKSKKSIFEWRKRVGEDKANQISTRAASRGTKFHSLCEDYFNGNLDEKECDNPLALNMFRVAKKTLDRINNIYCLETPLYSEYLSLAGRVDCIAEFDGELAVIDFKTSTKEKEEKHIEHYFVQETAYAVMFYERTGIKVKKIVTLISTEEGSIQIFERYNLDDYLQLLKSYIQEFVGSKTND